MLRKPLVSFLLAVALLAAFAGGLVRLFGLRYEVGDIYPPYSTLRADPLGTKALAAALGEMPGITMLRNFKPLPKMRPAGPVTLVYPGVAHRSFWGQEELMTFDSLVAGGSRAVFTFFPVEKAQTSAEDQHAEDAEKRKKENTDKDESDRKKKSRDKKTSGKKDGEEKKKSKEEKPGGDESEREDLIPFATVAKRWGFSFGYLPEENGKPFNRHAALVEPGGHLEPDISWHSALYFKDLKPQWKVLYMCGTMPVVIERKFGDGSIILAADSFFLSNEALRGERHPRLISRLFDGPPTIVFDEEHNGLREAPGIASLARKYHLQGLAGSLLVLAILFLWKNVVRFVPAYASTAAQNDVVAGKESSEGFINLLRRSIAPSAIFEACLAEWREAFGHKAQDVAKLEEIRAHMAAGPAAGRDPIAAYATISRALARKI